jgi:hypothetical protein
MKRYRRLRRLLPDEELLRRRAGGEPLRQLADDYGVSHTTLGRYFARPAVARRVREAGERLRAEQRAASSRRQGERRLEQEVRRRARAQEALERASTRRAAAAEGRLSSRRRVAGSHAAWLDEKEARRPLTRAELHSGNDKTAALVVAEGGGLQAVIDATGLRTRENVIRLIDPAILEQALDNDLLGPASQPPS